MAAITPGESERAALEWARQYLAGHHCTRCGREWITGASVRVLMHRCQPPRRRYTFDPPDREEGTQAWARGILGDELANAVERRDGPDPLYRQVDP